MRRAAVLAILALSACSKPAAPPEPATVSADEKSPRAAAALVARYFALVEAGRYDEAVVLWPHGAPDRRPGLRFQIGAPSSPEGACGSVYVRVPVRITGRSIDERRTVNLRRVNDVDGSTPAQRRWRIDSIEPA